MNTKPKMWLGVCASLLVGTAVVTTSSALSAPEPQNDLLRANVEALSNGEGTSVGTCYTSGGSGSADFFILCNIDTSSSMIYPCETTSTYGSKGVASMCTK